MFFCHWLLHLVSLVLLLSHCTAIIVVFLLYKNIISLKVKPSYYEWVLHIWKQKSFYIHGCWSRWSMKSRGSLNKKLVPTNGSWEHNKINQSKTRKQMNNNKKKTLSNHHEPLSPMIQIELAYAIFIFGGHLVEWLIQIERHRESAKTVNWI